MWPNLKKYVNATVKEEIPKPTTKAFEVVREATGDPLTEVKLNAFLSITKMVTPFLTLYQTDRLMIPFLASDLHKLLKQLLVRFVKNDIVESLSLSKLEEVQADRKDRARVHCSDLAETVAAVKEIEGICPYSITIDM